MPSVFGLTLHSVPHPVLLSVLLSGFWKLVSVFRIRFVHSGFFFRRVTCFLYCFWVLAFVFCIPGCWFERICRHVHFGLSGCIGSSSLSVVGVGCLCFWVRNSSVYLGVGFLSLVLLVGSTGLCRYLGVASAFWVWLERSDSGLGCRIVRLSSTGLCRYLRLLLCCSCQRGFRLVAHPRYAPGSGIACGSWLGFDGSTLVRCVALLLARHPWVLCRRSLPLLLLICTGF